METKTTTYKVYKMARGSGCGSRGKRSGGGAVVNGAGEARQELDKAKYQKLMNTEEGAALDWYLRDGFLEINNALRNDAVIPEMQTQIKQIDSAIEKLPAYRGTAYRAIALPAERISAIEKVLKPGMAIDAPEYSSSSAVRSQGSRLGAINLTIHANGKGGRAVFQLGKNPHEQEVLFRRDSRFKVNSIKKGKHGIGLEIDVTEI